jgi:hypothetical protein
LLFKNESHYKYFLNIASELLSLHSCTYFQWKRSVVLSLSFFIVSFL